MEPLFFKAENDANWQPVVWMAYASMEPLFFKAENDVVVVPVHLVDGLASMEPLFFKAENTS